MASAEDVFPTSAQDELYPKALTTCGDVMHRRLHAIKPLLLYGSIMFLFTYAFGLTVVTVEIRQRLSKAEGALLAIQTVLASNMEVWLFYVCTSILGYVIAVLNISLKLV